MALESNRVDSMERRQMPYYSESYLNMQKQHYLPDTSTTEHPDYEAVSSTSHFDMGLELNRSGRFIETDPNMYPIILDREDYVRQVGANMTEGINKPKPFGRPTVTREFVSPSGEKFVLSHLVQQPTNGRSANEGIKKRKRTRTAFTDNQIKKLEEEYASNRYLDQPRRQSIAKSLSLFERTVKIWFQNRRMKEKKMIREANEQSGDEELQRDNFRDQYYAVPSNGYLNAQPTSSFEVPQMSNCTPPNNSYGYGMCPPSYSEAVSQYPSNSQHYSVILPNGSNVVNTGFHSQIGFGEAVSSVYPTQNDSLRAAMSTLNVDDNEGICNGIIDKHSPKSILADEEVINEVSCSQKVECEVISDEEDDKSGIIDLNSFLQ